METVGESARFVRDIIVGILGSVRLLFPIMLTILLGWLLVEIAFALSASPSFHALAWLVWISLVIVAAIVVLGMIPLWKKDGRAKHLASAPEPPPIIPLLLWNVVLIAVVMSLAEARPAKVTFTYPLLSFYQFLFRLIRG
jgi:hypothetical protein